MILNSAGKLGLPNPHMGASDLCEHFNSAVRVKRLQDPALRDLFLKQSGVFAFQEQFGMAVPNPILQSGPLCIFEAEKNAEIMIAITSKQKAKELIPKEFQTPAACKFFADNGAPSLAKLYKP